MSLRSKMCRNLQFLSYLGPFRHLLPPGGIYCGAHLILFRFDIISKEYSLTTNLLRPYTMGILAPKGVVREIWAILGKI